MALQWINQDWLDDKRDMKMLSKFITDNRLIMFAANASNGKTTLVLSQIEEILERYPNKRVIYGDYDQGIHRANYSLFDRLIAAGKLEATQINNAEQHEDFVAYIDTLQNPENAIIVIDGFQGYVNKEGYSITDNTEMQEAMNDFKRLRDTNKLTIIIIHHNNKENEKGDSSFRGASVIEDALDSYFYPKGTIADGNLDMSVLAKKFDGMGLTKGETLNVRIDTLGYLQYEIGEPETVIHFPKGVDREVAIGILLENLGHGKTKSAEILKEKLLGLEITIGFNKCKNIINTIIELGIVEVLDTGIKNKQVLGHPGFAPILSVIPSEPLPLDDLPAQPETNKLSEIAYRKYTTLDICKIAPMIKKVATGLLYKSEIDWFTAEEIDMLARMQNNRAD